MARGCRDAGGAPESRLASSGPGNADWIQDDAACPAAGRAGGAAWVAAAAVTCDAGNEVVEACVSVPAAKATVCNGDLPAVSACIGIGSGEDLLRYRSQATLQLKEEAVDLAVVTASGTVGHIRHIPMVLTGWGVGVIPLGRCWRIGPAVCCGGELARDGSKLCRHA